MNCIRLDQWSPHEILDSEGRQREGYYQHVVIAGICYDHPLKMDGAEVCTERLSRVIVSAGPNGPSILAVTVVGIEYELLGPAPSYEEVFPNARQRIFDWWYKQHPDSAPRG